MAKGDVNNDGRVDVYLGGAQDQPAALYFQNENGIFIKQYQSFVEDFKSQEDLAATFFDADGDGDSDLYVVSGGNEKPNKDAYYRDRFYLNDGNGNFDVAMDKIPTITTSGSCVKPFDFDQDGDLDLFVGSRHTPGAYPFASTSYLLENKNGSFVDVTKEKAPSLSSIGMVTDAIWTDVNKDGVQDMILVGEWMPVTFLIQKDGKFEDKTDDFGMTNTRGWWNTIHEVDIDKDGDDDFVLGNLGLNYKYRIKENQDFYIYASDFDENGTSDIVLGYAVDDKLLPLRGKQCSTQQIPSLEKKFPTYNAFANASLTEIYGEKIEEALHYEIDTFHSSLLLNEGGSYVLNALPNEAQSSPVNGVLSKDYDGDGHIDLLMAGNMHNAEVETGRADSGIGFYLKGDGAGNFDVQFAEETGFFASGDVKHLVAVSTTKEDLILVVRNNGVLNVVK